MFNKENVIQFILSCFLYKFVFILVVDVPYLSKYQHASPRRKDSGTYKIQAVNKYGQDTAELEIIVTCELTFTLNQKFTKIFTLLWHTEKIRITSSWKELVTYKRLCTPMNVIFVWSVNIFFDWLNGFYV